MDKMSLETSAVNQQRISLGKIDIRHKIIYQATFGRKQNWYVG